MKKPGIDLLVAILLISGTVLHAQSSRKHSSRAEESQQQTAQSIQRLEDELRVAIIKGDTGWFEEHLASNYIDVDAQGKVSNRSQIMDFYRTSPPEYDSWNLSEATALTYNGNTVILTGKLELLSTVADKQVNTAYRFLHVWIKEGTDWQLAAQQETRIPK